MPHYLGDREKSTNASRVQVLENGGGEDGECCVWENIVYIGGRGGHIEEDEGRGAGVSLSVWLHARSPRHQHPPAVTQKHKSCVPKCSPTCHCPSERQREREEREEKAQEGEDRC